ncbi:sensor histidine kinase [Sphaerisporangium fuscum]|uniref:sensor histidine kinase n=1 Tax=Sphaerisporangium fuscum TaxID=2835868 RepID=UPI001BDD23F0|nr:DUF4118 domain-containing protein [Sphaerisporangium fuscum]
MVDAAPTPAPRAEHEGRLPLPGAGLPGSRRGAAFVLAAVALPALTAVLVALRGTLALESVLLLYLLAVVVVAVVGGTWPALVAAVASFLLANFFFAEPLGTFFVSGRDSLIALTVFLAVAVTVSVTVDMAARRRVAESRSRMEARIMSRVAAEPVAEASLSAVLNQVRSTFAMRSVALLERRGDGERQLGLVGPPLTGRPAISVTAGPGLRLVGEGPQIFAEDRRVLSTLAQAAGRVVEGRRLAGQARQARELAEIDRVRAALLAAVGHDLRTPLAGIKAAVSSLRQADVEWSEADRQELLAAIEDSTDRLGDLIANLLDMTRLQAGALSISLRPVAVDEIVASALIGHPAALTEVEVPDDLPHVLADPGIAERVVANLVANARRFSPPGRPVRVQAEAGAATVRLQVIDRGPGVPESGWERMFQPFQRLDDRSPGGSGLGLAIARGFTEAMGGTLRPSATPGGGLTMTITLPRAST